MPGLMPDFLDEVAGRLAAEMGPDLDIYAVVQVVRQSAQDLAGEQDPRPASELVERRARERLSEPFPCPTRTRRAVWLGELDPDVAETTTRLVTEMGADLDAYVISEVVRRCAEDLRGQVPRSSFPELVERCARARLCEVVGQLATRPRVVAGRSHVHGLGEAAEATSTREDGVSAGPSGAPGRSSGGPA
ncbi:MAG: hypothetical protein ACRDYU_01310 [Actinomycetes bacterium]